ncbi:hypothetical protein D9M73_185940 [compost metagenome]
MVGPDHETEHADGDDGPDHHAVAEDVLAGVGADQVRHQAEGRQGDDVHLRMAEEPEEVLEQDRAAALVIQRLAHRDHRGHEEAGAEQAVEQHHDGADEQRREGEQGEDRGHEDTPHRERHAEQGHAVGAGLQHRGHVVQAAHGGGDDEDRQRNQHQHDAPFGARRALGDRLRWVERPARAAGPAGDEEAG